MKKNSYLTNDRRPKTAGRPRIEVTPLPQPAPAAPQAKKP